MQACTAKGQPKRAICRLPLMPMRTQASRTWNRLRRYEQWTWRMKKSSTIFKWKRAAIWPNNHRRNQKTMHCNNFWQLLRRSRKPSWLGSRHDDKIERDGWISQEHKYQGCIVGRASLQETWSAVLSKIKVCSDIESVDNLRSDGSRSANSCRLCRRWAFNQPDVGGSSVVWSLREKKNYINIKNCM